MKRENWIYLLAFLGGVVIVNMLGSAVWSNNSILNRYSLASLSFQGIVYEQYFVQILLLRFRLVAELWVLSRVFSKKIVSVGFALIVSVMLGGIAAMAIMANGVWGVLFYFCVLMPHGIFYAMAYICWTNVQMGYLPNGNKKNDYSAIVLTLILTGIGCICEAFISPVLVENVIKF